MRYLLLYLLLISGPALAEKAEQCLQFGTTEKGQSIKNVCGEDIVVIWCHDYDKQGYQGGLCGSDKRFFQYNTVLKPGEINANYYSLPANAHISTGACFGSYGSYKYTDKIGGYLCKPPKTASGDTVAITSTASAPTAEEACKKAQSMAGKDGNSGECACQVRAKVSICRVQSTGAKHDTAVGNVKEKIRELAECNPDDNDCIARRSKSKGGIGIRG